MDVIIMHSHLVVKASRTFNNVIIIIIHSLSDRNKAKVDIIIYIA